MSKKVYIFLAEGFEEVEALTSVDVLRRAKIDIKMVSVTNKNEVTGSHGITVIADGIFDDFDYSDADMIVLPGGTPGANNLNAHEKLGQWLSKHNSEGKMIGAICAAPLVLGQKNILKDHIATCYPGFENQLIGAKVTGNSVEISKNIVTGKGIGAAMEFSLTLVAQLTDQHTAEELSKKMVITK